MLSDKVNDTIGKRKSPEENSGVVGMTDQGSGLPCYVGLLESIRGQRIRAEEEVDRCSRLRELEYLMDKNPEVVRILELMDMVRR